MCFIQVTGFKIVQLTEKVTMSLSVLESGTELAHLQIISGVPTSALQTACWLKFTLQIGR